MNIDNNNNNNSNSNSNINKSDVDSYKQFSEYALTLYKFMVEFLDKYGVMAVDWMGYSLGLNKEGKPLSKQSPEELAESFRELAEHLKDPEVQAALILAIKEAEPILKEAMFSLINVSMGAGEFILKDAITFVCSDTPAAPICGLFKFANNTVEFGQDILDTGRSSLKTAQDTNRLSQNMYNNLQNARENLENKKQNLMNTIPTSTDLTKNINNIKNTIPTSTNLTKNIKNTIPTSNDLTKNITNIKNTIPTSTDLTKNIQSGGAKVFKKLHNERKHIETRIHKSLNDFLNLKKHRKTRRIRNKNQ